MSVNHSSDPKAPAESALAAAEPVQPVHAPPRKLSDIGFDEGIVVRPASAAPLAVPVSTPAVLPPGLKRAAPEPLPAERPRLDLPLIIPREPTAGDKSALPTRLEAFRPAEPRFAPHTPPPPAAAEPVLASLAVPEAEPTARAPAAYPAEPLLPRLTLRRGLHFAGRALKWGGIALAIWFVIVVGLTALFRFVNPPVSMLMMSQRLGGMPIERTWAPLSTISPNLRRAVITSEDAQFCHHFGFDFGEIRAAMRAGGEGFGRGASTISQQVAKNLFLWPGKSYVRKALEVPLTLVIEGLWPKRRIFEVYLNIAEWGPGVFGAEAAAQYYFSHPASELSEREAALMAVALPNPIARDASDPDPSVERRATRLQTRMRLPGTRGCVINLR